MKCNYTKIKVLIENSCDIEIEDSSVKEEGIVLDRVEQEEDRLKKSLEKLRFRSCRRQ